MYINQTWGEAHLNTGSRVLSAGLKHLHNKANVLVQCCALRDRKIHFCVYCLFYLYRCVQLLQVIYQNDQQVLLDILDIIIQYHMIIT